MPFWRLRGFFHNDAPTASKTIRGLRPDRCRKRWCPEGPGWADGLYPYPRASITMMRKDLRLAFPT